MPVISSLTLADIVILYSVVDVVFYGCQPSDIDVKTTICAVLSYLVDLFLYFWVVSGDLT